MPTAPQVTLESLKGGKVVEMFDQALNQVLENIEDPNTKPDGKRSITITVDFEPSENRDQVAVTISNKVKLVGIRDEVTTLHVGRRGEDLVAVEYDPRQMTFGEVTNPASAVRPLKGGK